MFHSRLFPGSISLALVASACAPVQQPRSAPVPETIRIATWNIEHLAEANGTGCRPRTDQDYLTLQSHAERLRADVIALQEIQNLAAAQRVFTPDKWNVVMSERPSSGRSSECRGLSGLNILDQRVGFAIRKHIPFRRNSDVSALGLGDPDLRWGVDVTLMLPRPIRLLGVHLKSGCAVGRDNADQDCEFLFRQAPFLERWIDDRARANEDFAVLGDWNRRLGRANDEFSALVSDDDPPAGRLVQLNAAFPATCKARYKEFIDHIAVGKLTFRRVRPSSFIEYRYGVPESQHPSDHCPLSIDLSSR